jgi:hypothetical protein
MKKLLTLFVLLYTLPAIAQVSSRIYLPNPNKTKVFVGGNEQKLPWTGGVNNPQFAMADLNKDGKKDLVIYEQYYGVRTFLYTGTGGDVQYTYAPLYENDFPQIEEYIKLEDYNRDGIADLFHFGRTGVVVCKGYYNAQNHLSFEQARTVVHKNTNGRYFALDVNPADIPAIIDVDGDGDLDIITYYQWGSYIYMYRNVQADENMHKDSMAIRLKDHCWGKTYQNTPRTHDLGYSCNNAGLKSSGQNKVTDGNNALCLFDVDGDGDYDCLGSNNQYADIQFFKNGKKEYGHPVDSMIAQDSTWQSAGTKLQMSRYPSAFWLDIDNDGDRDILISPHAKGSENYYCIARYRNDGNDNTPNFVYQTNELLVNQMIDVGSNSYPVFYDYNKDGKQDLFIGTLGYYQPNGSFRSRVALYTNTSSGSQSSLELTTTNFLNTDNLKLNGMAPAFGDLDNDGLDDMVLGHINGTLSFFKNTAANNNVTPIWDYVPGQIKNSAGATINVTGFATPLIYDIDKDGKKDLLIGNAYGYIAFYKNNGQSNQLSLGLVKEKLGEVNVGDANGTFGYAAPFIGKIDNTGTEYLLVGSQKGVVYKYDGFQNGNVTTPYKLVDTFYSYVKSEEFATPAVTDIDNDGKYDMVLGSSLGGLKYFEQIFNDNVPELSAGQRRLILYPNPATEKLAIALDGISPDRSMQVKIYNSIGQAVSIPVTLTANSFMVDVATLPAGVYMCSMSWSGGVSTATFIKQ